MDLLFGRSTSFLERSLSSPPSRLASGYLLFAGLAWILAYWLFRNRWFHRKIIARFPQTADVRRELGYSLLTLVIFGLMGAGDDCRLSRGLHADVLEDFRPRPGLADVQDQTRGLDWRRRRTPRPPRAPPGPGSTRVASTRGSATLTQVPCPASLRISSGPAHRPRRSWRVRTRPMPVPSMDRASRPRRLKGTQQVRQLLRRHAQPVVLDLQHAPCSLRLQAQHHLAPRVAVLDGVGQQVDEHLPHPQCVTLHPQGCGVRREHVDGHSCGQPARGTAHESPRAADGEQVDGLGRDLQGARFDARQVECGSLISAEQARCPPRGSARHGPPWRSPSGSDRSACISCDRPSTALSGVRSS